MVRSHVVRILGLLAALAPFLVARYPGMNWEAVAAISAALMGGSDVVQRLEDRKTAEALDKPAPELAAELAQAWLALAEVQQQTSGNDTQAEDTDVKD